MIFVSLFMLSFQVEVSLNFGRCKVAISAA